MNTLCSNRHSHLVVKRIGQRLNSYHQSVPNQSSVILYTLPPPNTNMSGFVNYGDLITLTTMCGEKEGHLNADGVIDNSLRILVMEKKISIPAKFRDCSKRNHKQFEFNKTKKTQHKIQLTFYYSFS